MKRLLLFAGIVALLFSCASFPEPEGQGNSLVIGNFILDFPDGFFDLSARKITSGVTLHLANRTKGTKFALITSSPGYFYFLTNGSDEFELESSEYAAEGLGHRYKMNIPIRIKIMNTPDKVIYLGHITSTYTLPKIEKESGTGSRTWNFETEWTTTWDQEGLRLYIVEVSPNRQWLNREVLEYRAKAD